MKYNGLNIQITNLKEMNFNKHGTKLNKRFIRRTKMSKVFREWFDTVDKNSQEWLDFVKQQEQDDEMSAQILEDIDGS